VPKRGQTAPGHEETGTGLDYSPFLKERVDWQIMALATNNIALDMLLIVLGSYTTSSEGFIVNDASTEYATLNRHQGTRCRCDCTLVGPSHRKVTIFY
jgi:hypothetical protein